MVSGSSHLCKQAWLQFQAVWQLETSLSWATRSLIRLKRIASCQRLDRSFDGAS